MGSDDKNIVIYREKYAAWRYLDTLRYILMAALFCAAGILSATHLGELVGILALGGVALLTHWFDGAKLTTALWRLGVF